MAYIEQRESLAEILSFYNSDCGLELADYLVQSGVVIPEALTDAECSRAWLMGDTDSGQDYSPQGFRTNLLLVANRAFMTGDVRSKTTNRLLPAVG